MGTGVKWGRCNIGAASPEEYGDYYAWGETKTKDVYSHNTYTYYNNGKYVDLGKDISGTAFDVAHVKLGGTWRMPTNVEWSELLSYCKWNYIKYNGINGCLVISKSNNNSIFLPAAGYRDYDKLLDADKNGHYWSSSLCDFIYDAWGLYFVSDGGQYIDSRTYNQRYRSYGLSVRAVCE